MSKNLIIIEKNGEIRLSDFPEAITEAPTITFFFYDECVLISPRFDTRAIMFKEFFTLPNTATFNSPQLTAKLKERFGNARVVSCTELAYNTFSTLKGCFAYEFERRITCFKEEDIVIPPTANEIDPRLIAKLKHTFGNTHVVSFTERACDTFFTLISCLSYEFKRIIIRLEKKGVVRPSTTNETEPATGPSPVNEKTQIKYVEVLESGINLVNFGEEFLAQEEIPLTILNNGIVIGPIDKEPTEATIYATHENGFIEDESLIEIFGWHQSNDIMPYSDLKSLGYFPDNSNLDRLIKEIGI